MHRARLQAKANHLRRSRLTRFLNRIISALRAAWRGLLPPWQNRRTPWAIVVALIIFALGNLVFWTVHVPSVPQNLEAIRKSGRLVVLTRLAPTTFYLGTEGQTGFEYLLTQALGKSLGVEVEYRTYDSTLDLLDALRGEKGNIAATGLLLDDTMKKDLAEGPGYQKVSDIIVCRRDIDLPNSVKDLAPLKIWVSSGTSAAERLVSAQSDLAATPDTPRATIIDVDQPVEILFSAVAAGNLDCTASNSIEFKVNNPFYPDLVEAFSLGGDDQLTWLFAPGADDLADYVKTWMAAQKKSGALDEMSRRFFGFLPPFDYVDVRAFNNAVETTLPDYEKTMRDAARESGLPWQLIAAVAYQESHWDPEARSHTGVRGIMMLTEDTATHLGVANRLDPVESLLAGAAYIAYLRDRIPEDVAEPDRLWFALAAYNMGYGHLLDARALAESLGLNKNRWTDLRRALSMMGKPAYASRLKNGPARGGQALRFVQQVRAYQHILDAPR
tara:strand:- start:19393 stop:20892 length:1500 start_codon:yes stop_codon:yes gene_type:complete